MADRVESLSPAVAEHDVMDVPVATPVTAVTRQANDADVDTRTVQASATSLPSPQSHIKIAPLQYMDVFIGERCWPALVDSAAEVPLIHRRVLGETHIPTVGNIFIQPIVGPVVEAKLVALDVTQYVIDQNLAAAIGQAPPLHVTFAVTERLNGHDVVLPASPAKS